MAVRSDGGALLYSPARPCRVVADGFGNHPPPHAVAPADRCRQARQGHQRVHYVRVRLAPHPNVHAAHAGAHDQAQMVDVQAIDHQAVFSVHHVGVLVVREFGMQSPARATGLPVADVVGQDHVKLRHVQRLARPKQLARKDVAHELRAAAGGAVHDEHRVANHAVSIPLRNTERPVVDFEFRQRLAGGEVEILDDVVSLRRHRQIGGHRRRPCQQRG